MDSFERALIALPFDAQRLYIIQEDCFQKNWKDGRLHLKKIKGLPHTFSFRVTRRYRAFFYFQDPKTVIFFDIDHRKDSYRNL